MGILALLFAAWFEKTPWLPTSTLWRVAARAVVVPFIFIHLTAAPASIPFTTSRAMHNIQVKSIETPIVAPAEQVDFKNKTVVLKRTTAEILS